MARKIWLSPVLGNNRERLLARCAEYLERGQADRLLYITASHPLLDLVTEKLLDGKHARGVWGEFPVYLFRGFVRRILSEANLPQRVPIDREELPLRKSLISQIIKQLSVSGRLHAIKPLVNRDGCVNTIALLIGELQRAGKTAEEFARAIEEREAEGSQIQTGKSPPQIPDSRFQTSTPQIDFDREVALIYERYAAALDQNGLTDEDADQLRALQFLRGDVAQVVNLPLSASEPEQSQINNLRCSIPWLDKIELLVLDGFFDFTPVPGHPARLRARVARGSVGKLYSGGGILSVGADVRRLTFPRKIETVQSLLTSAATFSNTCQTRRGHEARCPCLNIGRKPPGRIPCSPEISRGRLTEANREGAEGKFIDFGQRCSIIAVSSMFYPGRIRCYGLSRCVAEGTARSG